MTNERVPEKHPSPADALYFLTIALLISAALVGFWLRGGWNLGLTLAITTAEAGVWLYSCGFGQKPVFSCLTRFSAHRRMLLIGLTLAILYLGSTYYFYANELLHVLNFLVLLVLFVVQSILLTDSSDRDWDEPLFWLEAALAPIVRPFVSLPRVGFMTRLATGAHHTNESGVEAGADTLSSRARPGRLFGQILLGILLAVPVLLFAGSLLASADIVFGRVFSSIIDYWTGLSIKDRLIDLVLVLFLFPFIFSFLESCRSRWQLVSRQSQADPVLSGAGTLSYREKTLKLNPVTLNAFLASINMLYLLFAIIQIAYLTGAFQFVLPEGLTYAEYARNGFFELAGITPINVLLILLAIKGAGRKGLAGRILRGQSLLLVAGSFIQWLSAMFRMQMYIRAYDLTLMRFFVSAFMILMAVVLVLLTVKEFRPSFAFFKAAAISALLSLVLLNAINVDIRIARFNTGHSLENPARPFDLSYFQELSPDAALVLQESLAQFDESRRSAVQQRIQQTYQNVVKETREGRWQDLNWREQKTIRELAAAGYNLQASMSNSLSTR